MTTADLVFTTLAAPPEKSLLQVDTGLELHNQAAAPVSDVKPLASFATDGAGQIVGGAVGRTWGGCCELLQLCVSSERRSSGVGSGLLLVFEKHARGRACTVFYLTTLSFQAPTFYRKRGHVALAKISGYPNGIIKYLMH